MTGCYTCGKVLGTRKTVVALLGHLFCCPGCAKKFLINLYGSDEDYAALAETIRSDDIGLRG